MKRYFFLLLVVIYLVDAAYAPGASTAVPAPSSPSAIKSVTGADSTAIARISPANKN
jgi:hypothetical protein